MEPRFLTLDEVIAIHQMQLAAFGGASGVRDLGMLESAVDRAHSRWSHERAPLPRLAATYAFGIARKHPFLDGNKRAAFMAAFTFLGINGLDFFAPEAEVVHIMLALAAGEVEDESLALWSSDNTRPATA